jgi:FkbM family methyltransferase
MTVKIIKKLKKVIRIFFPIDIESERYFINQIRLLPGYASHEQKGEYIEVLFADEMQIRLRNKAHSDLKVFQHIFVNKEYEPVVQLLRCNNFAQPLRMIDAGANVGFSSLYMAKQFKDARIICVEPSSENVKQIHYLIETNTTCKELRVIQKALAESNEKRFELHHGFRDQKDWSITTAEHSNGRIESVSIDEILKQNNWSELTLLKIDIEGAERFIFRKGNDLSFLNKTRLIAIEIHDEFNIRKEIHALLHQHGFILFEYGELTIGVHAQFYT